MNVKSIIDWNDKRRLIIALLWLTMTAVVASSARAAQ